MIVVEEPHVLADEVVLSIVGTDARRACYALVEAIQYWRLSHRIQSFDLSRRAEIEFLKEQSTSFSTR